MIPSTFGRGAARDPFRPRPVHDSTAGFYGGYDLYVRGGAPRWKLRTIHLAIGAALLVLIVLVAADASAIANPPPKVVLTEVYWYVGTVAITSTAGFTVHASQQFVLGETCQLFCPNIVGAKVSAPFQIVHVAITNEPVQYTNLTIQAPSDAYDGPLTITLEAGLSSDSVR